MKGKSLLIVMALSLFVLSFVPLSHAYNIIVRPDEVIVEPGAGVQFRAMAFTERGVPVVVDKFHWKVIPESLGEITDDGFFVAGKEPGRGVVVASARLSGRIYFGEAKVVVGVPPEPPIKIVVIPPRAVVPPGDTLRFRARAVRPTSAVVPFDRIRWEVRPRHLGKINKKGRFVAGNHIGQGKVVAIVEIKNAVYKGTAEVTVSPKPTSGISGNIVDDEDGLPIEGALVTAFRIGRIRWSGKARTDDDGNYLIDKLIPGIYVVWTRAKGYLPEFFDDARYYNEATPLTVAEFDTLENINFGLSRGASISGLVLAEEDSSALKGAHLIARLVVNPKIKHHTLSDEDGSYTLEALSSGTYIVKAAKEGYVSEFYDNVRNAEDASFIQVTEPEEVTGIDFALATASAISGKVIDVVTGEPIPRALVVAKSLLGARPRLERRSLTDENGEYIIGVPPGFYLVFATAEGFHGEFYKDVYDPRLATPVQVFADQHTEGIDFDLAPRGSISGTVVSADDGQPIAGAVVKAFFEGRGHRLPFKTETDSLGNYTLENLPAGKYLVKANARDYLPEFYEEATNPEEATFVQVQDSTNTSGIDFTLTKGGIISGFVYSQEDSLPIAGALVKVKLVGADFSRKGYTNEDGSYHINGLYSGSYIVMAGAKGYKPQFFDHVSRRKDATEVKVEAPDETADINFHLEPVLAQGGAIAGTVISSEDSVAIYGAVVVAIPLRIPGRFHWTLSGPDGQYKITNLRSGRYIVFAWARGFIGEFYDNVYSWFRATPVPVEAPEVTEGIDFALAPRGEGTYQITGVITSSDGTPLENVCVYASSEDGTEGSAVTDVDGSYTISGLQPGTYYVYGSGVNYDERYFGGVEQSQATPVNIGDGANATNIDFNLPLTTTGVGSEIGSESGVPKEFSLSQNYPNPFNPETNIKYQLPVDARVTIKIYNLLGQEVKTLIDGNKEAGSYNILWDGRDNRGQNVATGIYIYRMEAHARDGQTFIQLKKMTLMK